MMRTNYNYPWFKLEDFIANNNFGKKRLANLPKKFEKQFDSVEELWETATIRIQSLINLHFDGYFDLIPFEMTSEINRRYIMLAIFDTFEAILFGRLPINSNVDLIITNNSKDYSLTNYFKNNNGSITDIFPPSAMAWLSHTNIKKLYKVKSWNEVFEEWSKTIDPNELINKEYVKTLVESLDLTNRNVLKLIDDEIAKNKIDDENWKKETLGYIESKLDLAQIAKNIINNDETISNKIANEINNRVADIPKMKADIDKKADVKYVEEIVENQKTINQTQNSAIENQNNMLEKLKIKAIKISGEKKDNTNVLFKLPSWLSPDKVIGISGQLMAEIILYVNIFNLSYGPENLAWYRIPILETYNAGYVLMSTLTINRSDNTFNFALESTKWNLDPDRQTLLFFYAE
ncbi:hypothetical protein [Mesoplasma lactucae]|uniref:Uncharacterized protein n=1 Tax=Mesoplasma lactucae ATCC 49193 TaxID=81460 RepID=A0A291IRX1_9MOLU|nr:hypothetical protein [Mesoplasma lactucae]ATG97500.1 hypothetical protein CP520_01900 [Mesoplasma lactucae ATCC 49193]ATZ20044.1 hypothetical protein MLACT_v1c02220 [Mesoplasma lactucae ATCC 49193]MCL8217005.1 hypothetical protein [Mesoplasma lactucae ATCC 49193]